MLRLLPLLLGGMLMLPATANAANPRWATALLDDFSAAGTQSLLGTDWSFYPDTSNGGRSALRAERQDGILSVNGSIAPGYRGGGPGWAGWRMPLSADGAAYDVQGFSGLRIRYKAAGAPLYLRLHTATLAEANTDHHAVRLPRTSQWETLELPFSRFGQLMSRQRAWTGTDMTGVELIASSFLPADFSYEVDFIEFYRAGESTT